MARRHPRGQPDKIVRRQPFDGLLDLLNRFHEPKLAKCFSVSQLPLRPSLPSVKQGFPNHVRLRR
jgi:hypothetical protein